MKVSIILDVSDRQIRKREWLSWWSTTLPRSGPRVRVPSRALIKLHIRFLYCFYRIQYISASGSVGGARPCQGRGRGFESRLALYRKKEIHLSVCLFFSVERLSDSKGSRFSFHFGVAFLKQIRYNNRKKCVKKG